MNKEALLDIIAQYKETFETHRPKEIYKWRAVKHFQDNWDKNAVDFAQMLKNALKLQDNLLTQYEYMGLMFLAKGNPETLRRMFVQLYANNGASIVDKANKFLSDAKKLERELTRVKGNANKKHHQTERTVSLYLFFKMPEAHYLYNRANKLVNFSSMVGFTITSGTEMLQDYYSMCEQVRQLVLEDNVLLDKSTGSLNPDCYTDDEYHLLTDDIIYVSAINNYGHEAQWWPSDEIYHPGVSKDDWKQLWVDDKVFNDNSRLVVRSFYAFADGATCKEMSLEYGNTSEFYRNVSTRLAIRIHKKLDCKTPPVYDNAKWWPILYIGKRAGKSVAGSYIWKLRPELREVLDELDVAVPIPTIAGKEYSQDAIDAWHINQERTDDEKLNELEEKIPDSPEQIPAEMKTPYGPTYKRNSKVRRQAFRDAKYSCEVDSDHPLFLRKRSRLNYTELHHLIPTEHQDDFDNSLDVPSNAISLCSNCHNWLHYGADFEIILKKLYDARINRLELAGIPVSFDKLLEYYR